MPAQFDMALQSLNISEHIQSYQTVVAIVVTIIYCYYKIMRKIKNIISDHHNIVCDHNTNPYIVIELGREKARSYPGGRPFDEKMFIYNYR